MPVDLNNPKLESFKAALGDASKHAEDARDTILAAHDGTHPIERAVDALSVNKAVPAFEGSTKDEMLQHRKVHYPAVAEAAQYLHEAFEVKDADAKTQGRKWLTSALKRTGVGFKVAEQVVDGEIRRLAKDFPCGRSTA